MKYLLHVFLLALVSVISLTSCSEVSQFLGADVTEKTQTFTFDESIIAVDALLETGNVRLIALESATKGKVTVEQTTRFTKTPPSVEVKVLENGTLSLSSQCPKTTLQGTCSTGFVVQVPSDISVKAEINVGDISIRNMIGSIKAHVNVGNILGEKLSSPSIVFSSNTGSITADLLRPPTRFEGSSNTGNVKLTLPAGEYKLDTEVNVGSVQLDGIVEDKTSANFLKIDTNTGNISILGK